MTLLYAALGINNDVITNDIFASDMFRKNEKCPKHFTEATQYASQSRKFYTCASKFCEIIQIFRLFYRFGGRC